MLCVRKLPDVRLQDELRLPDCLATYSSLHGEFISMRIQCLQRPDGCTSSAVGRMRFRKSTVD